jgi:hypothetical protein
MEKRQSERILTNMGIRFLMNGSTYSGILKNCSEKGMHIKTTISFPFDPRFEVLIPLKEEVLKVPVEVVRLEKTGDTYDDMSVKVLNQHRKYVEFLIKLNLDSS